MHFIIITLRVVVSVVIWLTNLTHASYHVTANTVKSVMSAVSAAEGTTKTDGQQHYKTTYLERHVAISCDCGPIKASRVTLIHEYSDTFTICVLCS